MGTAPAIGIDLDGVVVDIVSAMVPKLSELKGQPVTTEDIVAYDIGSALGMPDETMDELWRWLEKKRVYATAPAIAGAVEAVQELEREEVCLLTCRSADLYSQTLEWLRHHGLADYSLRMGLDTHKLPEAASFALVIEDNATTAEELAALVPQVLLFDQPWNRNCSSLSNIVRVHGWNDIRAFLKM